mmetsp:Transcript_41588/g.98609  ORF Transcript_41588/g.98609 Transcript_41588/m.98609 type:complete len:218 (+) Transcript_41588:702-1355(+)
MLRWSPIVAEPLRPERMILGAQSDCSVVRSGTLERSATVMTLSSHGEKEDCSIVLRRSVGVRMERGCLSMWLMPAPAEGASKECGDAMAVGAKAMLSLSPAVPSDDELMVAAICTEGAEASAAGLRTTIEKLYHMSLASVAAGVSVSTPSGGPVHAAMSPKPLGPAAPVPSRSVSSMLGAMGRTTPPRPVMVSVGMHRSGTGTLKRRPTEMVLLSQG